MRARNGCSITTNKDTKASDILSRTRIPSRRQFCTDSSTHPYPTLLLHRSTFLEATVFQGKSIEKLMAHKEITHFGLFTTVRRPTKPMNHRLCKTVYRKSPGFKVKVLHKEDWEALSFLLVLWICNCLSKSKMRLRSSSSFSTYFNHGKKTSMLSGSKFWGLRIKTALHHLLLSGSQQQGGRACAIKGWLKFYKWFAKETQKPFW